MAGFRDRTSPGKRESKGTTSKESACPSPAEKSCEGRASDRTSSRSQFSLPKLRFDSNWKLPDDLGRQILALNMGPQLEEVAEALAFTIESSADYSCGREVFFDAKLPRRKGRSAAILTISEEQIGHEVGTTIHLRRRGEDLYFGLTPAARTRLRILHRVLRSLIFVIGALLLYGVIFKLTGQKNSLLTEYARKHHPSNPGDFVSSVKEGYWIDPESGERVERERPFEVWDIMRDDPTLFLLNMGRLPAIIMMVIGVAVRFMPPSSFDAVARALRWPTPSEFLSFASAEVGSIDAEACRVLSEEFGVKESDIRQVRGR